jgi:hypothetical protein
LDLVLASIDRDFDPILFDLAEIARPQNNLPPFGDARATDS